ncbi:MAG: hypothetical protein V3T84_14685 [Phycisphaerales bacterium]
MAQALISATWGDRTTATEPKAAAIRGFDFASFAAQKGIRLRGPAPWIRCVLAVDQHQNSIEAVEGLLSLQPEPTCGRYGSYTTFSSANWQVIFQ